MHEFSLIAGLLQMVLDSATSHQIKQVKLVRLVVGELYGALPESLLFAFEILTVGTICAGAKLEIVVGEQGGELFVDYFEGE